MRERENRIATRLSIVIPCYNEERTLARCIERVLAIADQTLSLEIIIVDDGSRDSTPVVAEDLAGRFPEVRLITHPENRGKGAALRTGFREVTGEFVAVQDADLEYDPEDLKRLLVPLVRGDADVVIGSRFLSTGAHRVLYFWHYLGNRILTLVSNMFTDLNLTDLETCYKVFRREVIQSIGIQENRFGFEPEIVAKVAAMRLRIYEMGISYYGRTYGEGKKIGAIDGLRALYCIFRYNANRAPIPIQFLCYAAIEGVTSLFGRFFFLGLLFSGATVKLATPLTLIVSASLNYLLCILLIFRHRAKWSSGAEWIAYWLVVGSVFLAELEILKFFLYSGLSPEVAKISASLTTLVLNFSGRRFIVFPEPPLRPWRARDSTLLEKADGKEPC